MENFLNYARHVNLDDFRINWVKNVIGAKIKKTELSIEEVEHIITNNIYHTKITHTHKIKKSHPFQDLSILFYHNN